MTDQEKIDGLNDVVAAYVGVTDMQVGDVMTFLTIALYKIAVGTAIMERIPPAAKMQQLLEIIEDNFGGYLQTSALATMTTMIEKLRDPNAP